MAYELYFYGLLLGLAVYFVFRRKRKNYPPGPRAYPLVGNLLSLGPEYHKTFQEHAKKYGPISSFKMGLDQAVILHDVKLIKEAFNDSAFSGRPVSATTECFAGKRDGIFQAEGRVWSEQRRFARRTLKDFGFGKRGMESLIMDEVQELTDWIAKQNGKPISLDGRFYLAVVNAMWTIVTGQRFEHDDPKLLQILVELDGAGGTVEKGTIMPFLLAHYPGVAKLIPGLSGWDTLVKQDRRRQELFRNIIQEHQATRDPEHPRDFIDVYLAEVESTTDQSSSFHASTATESLQSVLSDFFLAGADTTGVTLYWAILYLIHNPEVEQKLHQQLDRVVGNSRLPCLADKPNLPYVEAFNMEVLRFSSMIPLGAVHRTTEDVQFHGFRIPSGTKVFGNVYAVHFERSIWGDPESFRPERFLTADGLSVQKNENLLPFSTGKRACIAINLTYDQLFLFIARIVQRFDIARLPSDVKPRLDPRVGQLTGTSTLVPHAFTVRMLERK